MGKKKRRDMQNKLAGVSEETGSEITIHPDATLLSDIDDNPTAMDVIQRESTSAPNIGEEDPHEYVGSFAGLADKYLFSKRSIPFTILLIICGIGSTIIFIQDNNAGVLTDYSSILWALTKCLILCVLILLIWIVFSAVNWAKNRIK